MKIVQDMNETRARGHSLLLHPLQGSAHWAIFLDGSCIGARDGRQASASWACLVFERVGDRFYIVGFRTGVVSLEEDT